MKYTISKFAELLGVTVDTLRLYEKYNIITPEKEEHNNYRYFDDFDARNMLMSRWYRSLGFSMPEVAKLIQSGDFDTICDKIYIRTKELEDEIKQKELLLQKINNILLRLGNVDDELYRCSIRHYPGIYRIKQTNKNDLVKNDQLIEKVREWMEYIQHSFFSFRISESKILSTEHSFDYNWGLALYEESFHSLNLRIDDLVEYIEPKTYISSLILSSEEFITKDTLQFMIDEMHEKKYCMNGDIFGRIILTEHTSKIRQSLLEVNIPIK